MTECLRECESDDLVLRVKNTFLEWVFPAQGKPRSSSSPPTCRFQSISPAPVPPLFEMKLSPSPSSATRSVTSTLSSSPASSPKQKTMFHVVVDDDYGLHPSHPLWIGQTAMMIRNLPCRCKANEIKSMIMAGGVPSEKWTMVMPNGTKGRNRGYVFVAALDHATAMELVHVLWKQPIPTRVSQRPLKLTPAFDYK